MFLDKKNFDVVIVGGGAAGLSAAMWSDELGFSALLLEKEAEFGGQLRRVYNPLENYLGREAKNGRELNDIFLEQIEKRNFLRHLNCEVVEIDFQNKKLFLKNGEEISWRFLIVATGVHRRKLNVPGEDSFEGRGILESGKNEQATVKGKSVLVVGGGDAALENSLLLAETAANVVLIHRRAGFRGRIEFIEKVKTNPKINIMLESEVKKINGRQKIESVELENSSTGEITQLPVENILIRIGVEPNTELFKKNLDLNESGYLKVDQFCKTNMSCVFAVGDVANSVSPTVSTAVGMGTTAAKAIRKAADLVG